MTSALQKRLEYHNRKLEAMSRPRAVALQKVWNQSLPIVEHLIKRCICSNSVYHNPWEKELTSFCTNIQKIKLKGNKRLSHKEYITEFNSWLDEPWELDERIKDLIKEGRLQSNEVLPYNANKAYKCIRALLEHIVQDIADGNFTKFDSDIYRIPKPENLI